MLNAEYNAAKNYIRASVGRYPVSATPNVYCHLKRPVHLLKGYHELLVLYDSVIWPTKELCLCAIEHASEVCALRLFYFCFRTHFHFERVSANVHM